MSKGIFTLSLVCLITGLFLLAWRLRPAPAEAVETIIPKGVLPAAPQGENFASLSDYRILISWPRWIWREEIGTIGFTLTDLDDTPVLNEQTGNVQVLSLELDLFPLFVEPQGDLQVNIADEQDLVLEWEVVGQERGVFPGKVYLSFNFFDEARQTFTSVAVAVIDIKIEVIDLWGMKPGMVTWLGFIALLLWGVFLLLSRVWHLQNY